MELLYRYCKIIQPEIGRLVDGIDYSAVSYARKRLREKKKKDNKVRLLFESVEAELSRIKTLCFRSALPEVRLPARRS
ncbi:hypothetical protein [Desulfobacter postgatei]|jgi:hypothetical protein|uniref:hypothetical protein n=1 Tax=Desulfobacter postgatei TaxID=2293 RepID=UPI002A35CB99|nr:hypothetical protein [Desulfobacter postgatei]MDX9965117.1 hypothetical protein [Desulfobacter postgatei]